MTRKEERKTGDLKDRGSEDTLCQAQLQTLPSHLLQGGACEETEHCSTQSEY